MARHMNLLDVSRQSPVNEESFCTLPYPDAKCNFKIGWHLKFAIISYIPVLKLFINALKAFFKIHGLSTIVLQVRVWTKSDQIFDHTSFEYFQFSDMPVIWPIFYNLNYQQFHLMVFQKTSSRNNKIQLSHYNLQHHPTSARPVFF